MKAANKSADIFNDGDKGDMMVSSLETHTYKLAKSPLGIWLIALKEDFSYSLGFMFNTFGINFELRKPFFILPEIQENSSIVKGFRFCWMYLKASVMLAKGNGYLEPAQIPKANAEALERGFVKKVIWQKIFLSKEGSV